MHGSLGVCHDSGTVVKAMTGSPDDADGISCCVVVPVSQGDARVSDGQVYLTIVGILLLVVVILIVGTALLL